MSKLNLNGLVEIAENTPKIYEQGKNEGYNEGHETGYSEGKAEGYENGYSEGKTDGYELGADQIRELIEAMPDNYVIPSCVSKIDRYAFSNRRFKNVVIPNSVTEIDAYAFQNCSQLENITLSENVSGLAIYTFSNCKKLKSIKIPDSIKNLGMYVFDSCTSLTDVIFGENSQLGNIGTAFYECTSLQNINLPKTLTKIGYAAFYHCSSLTSITIPDSVTTIDDHAFNNCTSMMEYDFSSHMSIPTLKNVNGITVNNGTKIIVPPSLYNQWISATNWSKYKDYIVMSDAKAVPNEDNFNIYVDANTLKEIVDFTLLGKKLAVGVGNSEVLQDGDVPFLRIYGDGTSPEAYASIKNIEGKTTGRYLVFAYRLPMSNSEPHTCFEIYSNTTNDSFTGQGDVLRITTTKDGKWHVVAIDLQEAICSQDKVIDGSTTSKFIANPDGTYTIQKLRIDWFNVITSTDSYIDVAYVGICDTLELARGADANYTGAELDADYFVSKLSSKAVKSTHSCMEYVTITDTTQPTGEQFIELQRHDNILPNTSKYIGILYRNAPSKYAEVWVSSDNKSWATNSSITYDTADGWHFGVIALKDAYKDSVCRRLRFDYFNTLSANTEYSVDIAFVKFFGSEEEANNYYQRYKTVYNL